MPVYVKGDHKVNVSGEEAVAQFEAAGYSPIRSAQKADPKPVQPGETPTPAPAEKPARKRAAKKSKK